MTLQQPQHSDAGFADARRVQIVVRRIRLAAKLRDAAGSIQALLDILDQRRDAERDAATASLREAGPLPPSDREGVLDLNAIDPGACDTQREKELLDGVDVVLEFLDLVERDLRHGMFSCRDGQDGARDRAGRHSLCAGGK
jgi:hypothetical protein